MKPLVVKVLPNGQTVQTVLDDSRYRDGAPLLLKMPATTPPTLRLLEYTDDWLKPALERVQTGLEDYRRELFEEWADTVTQPVVWHGGRPDLSPAGESSP